MMSHQKKTVSQILTRPPNVHNLKAPPPLPGGAGATKCYNGFQNHTDGGIHSDHSYLETLGRPLTPPPDIE